MFRALVKTRFLALSAMISKGSKKKKNIGVKILIGIFILYLIGCFSFMFGSLFESICKPLVMAQLEWVYFSLIGVMSISFCLLGTLFIAQTQLYEARDNELLLSMPIPTKYILASRMVMLYGLSIIYHLLVATPGIVIYGTVTKLTTPIIICFIITILFLPILSMFFSCILGWILAAISSKMRSKNIIVMVFSLAFLGGYFYLYGKVQEGITLIITKGDEIGNAIRTAVFPIYHYGRAIAKGDFISLLFFVLCCVIPFFIIYIILSRNFIKLATTKRGAVKVEYKEKVLTVKSPSVAMIKKELRRFGSSPMYMMNSGLGLIALLIIAGAIVVKGDYILYTLNMSSDLLAYFNPLVAAGLGICCVTIMISAPSISLEGKSFWILQSIPVSPKCILLSKAKMHIIVSFPFIIIAATICNIKLMPSFETVILMFLFPLIATSFMALLGVAINIIFPRFDWVSEVVAVKQSMSTFLTLMIGFALIVMLGFTYTLMLKEVSIVAYLYIVCLALVILCCCLYRFICTVGVKLFLKL